MFWLMLVGIILGTLIAGAIACYLYTIFAVREAETEFPPQGKFVTVAGVKLHYISQGSGQPVILLHGNPGFIQDYASATINRIAKEYCVYAINIIGKRDWG